MPKINTHFGLSLFVAIIISTIILIFYNFFTTTEKIKAKQHNTTLQERIAPIGKVYLKENINITQTAKDKKTSARSAEQTYKSSCAACHNAGIAGAPKLKNKEDWAERKKLSIAELVNTVIAGKGAMPSKGACASCSDKELEEAVKYMLNSLK